MKFLFILLAVILIIPSSAFAGTWTIRIDQIKPIINYMNRLRAQKQQNSVKSHIIKAAVTPPMAGDKTPAVIKKKVSYSKLKALPPVRVYKTLKTQVSRKVQPAPARIHGSTTGLPVLTVDFKNKPLWSVLQDVSGKTGYMFTAHGVNLAEKVNLKGRYNFAVLLAKLFNGRGENTTLNLKTKRIHIWR